MDAETVQRLLDLNHQFYQSFAGEFSDTRGRLQPGVQKLLKGFPPESRILDLGCGNGELARQLARTGFKGTYLGTDFSPNLLEKVSAHFPGGFEVNYRVLDLAHPDWTGVLGSQRFDLVLCFAALHHIPSMARRLSVVRNIRDLIQAGGRFYLSNWQFLNSERLVKRILPWERVGLEPEAVDPGDYLLDWRRGGLGTRYVHHFSPAELSDLASESGFIIRELFLSDGKGGDLSLYQVWEPS